MDAFTLVAKLILDKSEYESGMAGVESEMNGMTGSGGGLTKWGVAAGQAIGTAVTKGAQAAYRFAKSVITTGMSFDEIMSEVRAVKEMSDDQFDAVRSKAMELGESTKFTAREVGEALYYMGVAGWDSTKMIAGIDGVLSLAAASGEDLGTTSDIVTDAITAFGMKAEDTGHFVDVLAAAASNANTTVGMMGEAFKYIAPVAGTLKYSVEDMAIAMGIMANNGVKSSQAGTALRQILNGLIDPSEDASKALDRLGISLYDSGGNVKSFRNLMEDFRNVMKKNGFDPTSTDAQKMANQLDALADAYERGAITEKEYYAGRWDAFTQMTNADFMKSISEIVGVRGLPALLAIMKATDEEWNQLAQSIDNSEGAAGKMADEMLNNLTGDLTLLNSALDGLKLLASDEVTRPIRQFIQDITKEIGELSKAFEEGGLAGMFNNLTKWITDGITNTLKSADFTEGAGEFGQALGDFVGNLVNTLVSNGSELMSGLFNAGMNLAGGLIEGLFAGLFGPGDDSLGYFMKKAQSDQQEAIDKANATAVEAQGIVGYLQSLVDQYGAAAAKTSEWEDAMAQLQSLIPGVSEAMKQENKTMSDMLDNMSQYIEQMRQQTVQQARQQTLQSYQDKYVQSEIALAQNQETYNQALSTMSSAQQAAYDLMKQAADIGNDYVFPQMFEGENAKTPSDIDLSSNWWRAALADAIETLNGAGQNDKGYSAGGILGAYDNAAAAAETSAGNMDQLAQDADSLKTQMKIAEDAIGNMGKNADDAADAMDDAADAMEDAAGGGGGGHPLEDLANEVESIDTSGLQSSLDGAASRIGTFATGANINTSGLQSAIDSAASALSGLASAASSVSFAGLGGGTLGGGVGPAPTVGHFAKGAWEIPYDEYPAMLHRGEMVLTASQARKYRSGEAGDLSPETLYQAVAGAVQQAVANIQINMDGVSVGNAVTKQVSKNLYKDQYGRRFATV